MDNEDVDLEQARMALAQVNPQLYRYIQYVEWTRCISKLEKGLRLEGYGALAERLNKEAIFYYSLFKQMVNKK